MTAPSEATGEWIINNIDPFGFNTYFDWLESIGMELGERFVYSSGFRSVIREIWRETKGQERVDEGLAMFGRKTE